MKNYSETSREPYMDSLVINTNKRYEQVLKLVKSGINNNLQLSEMMGIPQAVVSGCINQMVNAKMVMYKDTVEYKGRKRKRLELYRPVKVYDGTLF